ncbi:MAG: hypothetical protein AAF617_18205, partial [Bacteroidota bacterium]
TESILKEYTVSGNVYNAKENSRAVGFTVKAVDVDVVGENVLDKEVVTDAEGNYTITYNYPDFARTKKEVGGADIVVYVYDKKGKLVAKSDKRPNSGRNTKIDLKIG